MADTNPYLDPKHGIDLPGSNPYADPDFGKPRGAIAEIGVAAKRGLYQAASGVGATLQAPAEIAGEQPGVVSKVGKYIEDFGKQGAADNPAQPETHGPITNFLSEVAGNTSAIPMVAAGVAGGAAGALAGGVGAPVGAGAATAAQVGLQTFHEKYREALDAGKPDAEARDIATKSAALQGGLMGAGGAGGAVIARGGTVLGRALGKTAGEAATEATERKLLPEAGKSVAELTGINTGLGVAGGAGQAAIDADHGGTQTPLEAAGASIVPSLASSVAFAPIALLGAHGVVKHAAYVKQALSDPTAAPEIRSAAALHLASAMEPYDAGAAKTWLNNANLAIAAKQEVGLTPGWTPVAPITAAAQAAPGARVFPFRTEELAGKRAATDSRETGEAHAVVPNPDGSFAVKPQAELDAQAADEQAKTEQQAKVEEAKKTADAFQKTQVKEAETLAETAATTKIEGGEDITKKDARAAMGTFEEEIAAVRGQIETMRKEPDQQAAAPFIAKMEAAIEKTQAKQAKIAKRAGLPKPETTDAVQEPSAGSVLQREPPQAGEAGGERERVEPSVEGAGATAASAEEKAPAVGEGADVGGDQKDVTRPEGADQPDQVDRSIERAEPSTAQVQAGNYAKDHINVGPLDISIENRSGSVRRDKKHDPPQWESEIRDADYGYVRGTNGNDGEHVDAFVKPGTARDWSGAVYVVDQPGAKGFDEHKSLIGYDTKDEAVAAYKANYPSHFKVGDVSEMPLQVFHQWVKSKQTDRPATEREPVPLERMVRLDVTDETGRQGTAEYPAHEALSKLDDGIKRAKDLLECLSL